MHYYGITDENGKLLATIVSYTELTNDLTCKELTYEDYIALDKSDLERSPD